MALAKTVTYTPFNKTSFGYPNDQIQTDHPTLTNVLVEIHGITGNWDSTGHISTPSSGTAVSTYDSSSNRWRCEGTVADVDAVLDVLDFFPADYEDVRNWSADSLKPNDNGGSYAAENPGDTVAIPDTTMLIILTDPNNSYAFVIDETITFEAIQPTFGKQRPYWSTEPSSEDLATVEHGLTSGGLVDLGEISQLIPGTSVSDTDNLEVKCEFRLFGTTTQITNNTYGYFTSDTNIYVGDKKPGTRNTSDARLNFTGSLAEVQAYLDNIRFYRNSSDTAFDMYLTVSNGVVGSYLTKHVYFSDAVIGATTIAGLSYTEDTASDFDFDITTSNFQPDSDTFTATVTLDATGVTAANTFVTTTSVDSQSFDGTVLTITDSTEATLLTALSNLVFTPTADFNSSFNMTVQLTYTGSVNSSSYTSAAQTVAVAGIAVAEISNPTTSHTFTEDTVYSFDSGLYPQIIHPANENFTVTFTHAASTGSAPIWRNGSVPSTVSNTSTTFTMSGTRNEVNTGFDNLYYAPATDNTTGETITFTVDRTSGDLTHETQSTGSFVMTATAVGEYSITQPAAIDWFEDNSVDFDSGLAITDTSADDSRLPGSGDTYTVEIAMFDGGFDYTDGTIITNNTTGLTVGGVGNQNGQGDTNMISYTGSKTNINNALADLRLLPDCGTNTGPSVFYKLIRNSSPSATFTDQSPSTKTVFNTASGADYSYTFGGWANWNEDTPKDFDCGVRIVDGAGDNSGCAVFGTDYTATIQAFYWDGSQDQDLTTATWSTTSSGSASVTGNGKSGTPLVIDGTKADVNTALENLRMTPDLDWTDAPNLNGRFYIYVDLLRNDDSLTILDGSNFSTYVYAGFEGGTESPDYVSTVSPTMAYTEDIVTSIFSGKTVGIIDPAGDTYSNITYEVTLKLSDDGTTSSGSAGVWTGTSSHEITLGGSANISANNKASVNAAIQALQFTPTADYNTDVHILYTQKRYVSGVLDETQADDIDIGTVTATAVAEFTYGTANTNIQYYVADEWIDGVDTSDTEANILSGSANVTLTPKQISLNKGLTYDRPITVTDTYEDGGASQYKIVFSGGTLLAISGVSLNTTDTGWQTKADLHTLLDNGIYVTGMGEVNNNILGHNASNSVNFTIHRKSYTGTETQISNGSLLYTHQSGPELWRRRYLGPTSFSFNICQPVIDITYTTSESNTTYLAVKTNKSSHGSNGDDWIESTHGKLYWRAYDVDMNQEWNEESGTSGLHIFPSQSANIDNIDFTVATSNHSGSVMSYSTSTSDYRYSNTYVYLPGATGIGTYEFKIKVWTEWGAKLDSSNIPTSILVITTAGSFVIGARYKILTAGNTDFTLIGAANNNVGTIFTATGAGTGTGTVTPSGIIMVNTNT